MENLPEIFSYPLKIYDQINFGLLRPHGKEVKRALVVNRNIPKGLKNPKTLEEYETSLEQFFKNYPGFLSQIDFISKKEDYKKITSPDNGFFGTFENLIDISFPHTKDEVSIFYFYLITNEAKRFLIGLKYYLRNSSKEEKVHWLQRTLIVVKSQITVSIEKIVNQNDHLTAAGPWGQSKSIKKIYRFTYTALILALVRLYFEIIYTYSPLISDHEKNVEEFFFVEVEKIDVEKLKLELSFGLLRLKAIDLLNEKELDVNVLDNVLKELYNLKGFQIDNEKWQETVAALENAKLLFYDHGPKELEFYGSYYFAESELREKKEDFKKIIETHKMGIDRLNQIETFLSDLNLLFSTITEVEIKVKNSIFRKLIFWLNEQKERYLNQMMVSFDGGNTGAENDNDNQKGKGDNNEAIEYNSFKYDQSYEGMEKVANLKDFLKRNKIIDKKTKLPIFNKIFSGEVVKTKVVWTGGISALYYFVKLICIDNKVVGDLNDQHWKVATKCFELNDEKNKGSFTPEKIKGSKKPKILAPKIEKAASFLE